MTRGPEFDDFHFHEMHIFDVNAYVKEMVGRIDDKLEAEIVVALRERGWIVDKPQEGMSPDDLWWRARGAIMGQIAGLDLDYERRSLLAEDAARELLEAITVEMGEAPR